MADVFGDADWFSEFDRQRPASDNILKRMLDDEFRTPKTIGISNGSHMPGVYGTETAEHERRSFADNDVSDCGRTDTAECGENANSVHVSKLKHLENEVHRLTVLNIFFDSVECRVLNPTP